MKKSDNRKDDRAKEKVGSGAEVGMRLNKYVAHCGVASRRAAADLIKQGRVAVNGKIEKAPGYQIEVGDVVTFDGKKLQPEERQVYILMNKPKDAITTVKDERGRRTVIDLLRGKIKERIFPVGRLDRETTGLLLLTNDGDLAEKMTHPRYQMKKVYYASLDKELHPADLKKIEKGLQLEDGPVQVDWVEYLPKQAKTEVGLEIHVGRNRIVRRIFEHLGYHVRRLDRVYLGGLTKKDLKRGWWRHLTQQEIIMLKHFNKQRDNK
ncbi:MAG: rRNA pseudouridine synthase [Saprospiraceae bacterium]|nr:rRNA pseudouridine synthase [Saprospiraceae bacterium]